MLRSTMGMRDTTQFWEMSSMIESIRSRCASTPTTASRQYSAGSPSSTEKVLSARMRTALCSVSSRW